MHLANILKPILPSANSLYISWFCWNSLWGNFLINVSIIIVLWTLIHFSTTTDLPFVITMKNKLWGLELLTLTSHCSLVNIPLILNYRQAPWMKGLHFPYIVRYYHVTNFWPMRGKQLFCFCLLECLGRLYRISWYHCKCCIVSSLTPSFGL